MEISFLQYEHAHRENPQKVRIDLILLPFSASYLHFRAYS